jgi:hypothetical protein
MIKDVLGSPGPNRVISRLIRELLIRVFFYNACSIKGMYKQVLKARHILTYILGGEVPVASPTHAKLLSPPPPHTLLGPFNTFFV